MTSSNGSTVTRLRVEQVRPTAKAPPRIRAPKAPAAPAIDPAILDEIATSITDMGEKLDRAIATVASSTAKLERAASLLPTASSDTMNVVLSSFAALGYALSARALLLLALVGAFVLAFMAIGAPSGMSLGILIAYSLLTVGPVTVLEIRKTRS